MDNTPRDMMAFILNIILLSSLIFFCVFLLGVRSDIASVRNMEVMAKSSIADMYKYNLYQTDVLYGEDVVAAIRNLYDQGVTIAVNDAAVYETFACVDGSTTVVNGFYEVNERLARKCPPLIDTKKLIKMFSVNKEYTAVLTYGGVASKDVTLAYRQAAVNSDVTGVVFFYTGVRR